MLIISQANHTRQLLRKTQNLPRVTVFIVVPNVKYNAPTVAGASKTDADGLPTTSLNTSSLANEYSICSTNCPFNAAWRIVSLISSLVVGLFRCKFKTANETFGVGTRIALPVNLSVNSGKTRAIASSAPVSVITKLRAAERPRRNFLW